MPAYSGSVFELPKQGSWYGTEVTATNLGFYGPEAFDSAGNLFTYLYNGTADTESVVEYPWNGQGYGASTALGGWSNVYEASFYNFAADPSGDVALNVNGELNGGDLFAGVFEITPSGAGPQAYTPITPVRAMDTRNGTGVARGAVPAGGMVRLKVAGVNGIPANATAVAMNVTAVGATVSGTYVTVWPDGQTRPFASRSESVATDAVPNFDIVADRCGRLCRLLQCGGFGEPDR